MRSALAVLIGSLFVYPVFAVDKSDDIDTNRPSFCQSAFVVPMGSIQLENGALYQHFQHGLTYFDLPENQLRIGLLEKTELQVFNPEMVLYNQSASTFAGASGLGELGLKHQFGPFKRLTASLVSALNVPLGAKFVSGTTVQPVFRVPFCLSLNKNWSLCGMQSIILSNSRGDIQWQPFFMLSRSLGKKAAAFAEYAAFFQQNSHGPAQSISHFGAIYKLNRQHQLDLHFGFGLSSSAPSAFVGFGYSYRFDRLPWGK
ncbi:MAG: transporter [Candidatus Obscuribacterales bacterium]|nr:transporter [Candidatus Obscuribacterales bacterium]